MHINHHLSPNASRWATHCKTICKQLAVAYLSYDINLSQNSGESLEEEDKG